MIMAEINQAHLSIKREKLPDPSLTGPTSKITIEYSQANIRLNYNGTLDSSGNVISENYELSTDANNMSEYYFQFKKIVAEELGRR